MKAILCICAVFLSLQMTFSQTVPQGINYQAIAENAQGKPVINQSIGIRISIYSGSANGTMVWQETHLPKTNQFGLFVITIGNGISTGAGTAASFAGINWASANHYMNVSMDISGGSNYVDMDNSQLLSVPYALYSLKAGKTTDAISLNDLKDVDTAGVVKGKTLKWDGSGWKPAVDNNSDTAMYALTSGSALKADTADFVKIAKADTVIYAFHTDSAAFAINSGKSINANHANYSDTAVYALNCPTDFSNNWHLSGNSGINAASHFIGTINAADFVFKTNNVERMRITAAGKLGWGLTTPVASVHLVGTDGFIAQGTIGAGVAQTPGAGTRMMWYPRKAAFRAGYVSGNQWDDSNIGNYSFATGISSMARGIGAVAMGQTCSANDSCAVAMGYNSSASGKYGVAMGNSSIASGNASVALGRGSVASGIAAVGIGYHVTASGNMSTAFGYYTTASGNNSVAMGYRSSTNNMAGSFIFADNSSNNVVTSSTAPNQFMVKASGGTIFYSNSALSAGVSLAAGGGAWLSVSDKKRKENFQPVNGETILEKISNMEITSWNYKSQNERIRHIGPMAQDFYEAFHFGESDTTITATDIDGINIMAVQALEKRTQELTEKSKEIEALRLQLDDLQAEKQKLEKRILAMEKKLINTPAAGVQRRTNSNFTYAGKKIIHHFRGLSVR